jgi:Glycerophosphoryl diester phosphodiesterase
MAILIVFIALAAIFTIYAFLLAPGRMPKAAPAALWQARYAHRGLHDKQNAVPENSLAAFAAAAGAGYGIELDINLTTDDRVVVFHDESLKRMCGIDRYVADCAWEALSQCRLAGTEQRIPLFTEALSLVNGRVPLIVELKSTKRNAALCEKAAALLDAYTGPYCIESFHPGIVAWFKKNRPGTVRGQLAAGRKQYRPLPGWQALLLSSLLTGAVGRPHFAAFRHEDAHGRLRLWLFRLLGGRLVGWTVRGTDDIAWCERFFDVIIFENFKP